MPQLIRVDVTADDIRLGERDNPKSCAIAQAILRQHGERVAVYECAVDWCNRGTWSRLPGEAQGFIVRFDRGDDVEPFSFVIEQDEQQGDWR